MRASPPPVLEADGLAARFGGVAAVAGVSLRLEPGALCCLIGPNGAGKTSLFKCLAGLRRPASGRVRLCGADVTGLSADAVARRGLAVKMQTPHLMEGLSARENLWLAARPPRARTVDGVLARLELEPLANRPAAALPHGDRQRLALGMVMARRPRVALLDEPTAGLTGAEIGAMARIVRHINREAAVLIVEHDMDFVRALGGRVMVMRRGRIALAGSAEAILADGSAPSGGAEL